MNPLVYKLEKSNESIEYIFSATQMWKFFNSPQEFALQVFEGQKTFSGNTATVLGTLVHYALHGAMTGLDKEQIIKDIEEYKLLQKEALKDELDLIECEKWKDMANACIEYMSTSEPQFYKNGKSEEHVSYVKDNIELSGTIDLYYGDTIIDFKTTSKLSDYTEMTENYREQMYIYTWMLKQKGIDIRWITNVFIHVPFLNRVSEKTGKSLKDSPARAYKIVEEIDSEKLMIVERKINYVFESIDYVSKNPHLRKLVFKEF